MDAYWNKGGRDLILKCQRLVRESDPNSLGTNSTVNAACRDAVYFDFEHLLSPYFQYADVIHIFHGKFPS
jgi:hypothetical protein